MQISGIGCRPNPTRMMNLLLKGRCNAYIKSRQNRSIVNQCTHQKGEKSSSSLTYFQTLLRTCVHLHLHFFTAKPIRVECNFFVATSSSNASGNDGLENN